MSSTRKPQRPGLPSNREQILVPGLPAPEPAPASKPAAARPPVPPPSPYPGVQGYGRQPSAGGRTPKRADPPGMKRESYYVTQEAADAIDQAVERIRAALGGDIPKQIVLSALLQAAADQADEVAARIAADQAQQLTSRLDALRNLGQ